MVLLVTEVMLYAVLFGASSHSKFCCMESFVSGVQSQQVLLYYTCVWCSQSWQVLLYIIMIGSHSKLSCM